MQYYDDDVRKQLRTELYNVKNSAPHVWDRLVEMGLCPHTFGLPTNCGREPDCQKCWEEAMSLETTEDVKVSLTGRYFCVGCNQFLVKTEEKDNVRYYECPSCHTIFEMRLNTEGLVSKILNKGRKEQAETEVTDPNDPNYNPD